MGTPEEQQAPDSVEFKISSNVIKNSHVSTTRLFFSSFLASFSGRFSSCSDKMTTLHAVAIFNNPCKEGIPLTQLFQKIPNGWKEGSISFVGPLMGHFPIFEPFTLLREWTCLIFKTSFTTQILRLRLIPPLKMEVSLYPKRHGIGAKTTANLHTLIDLILTAILWRRRHYPSHFIVADRPGEDWRVLRILLSYM